MPEDFVAFVENSTSERQPEIDIRIQVTVNGQNCDTQYADVLKEHIKNIKDSVRVKFLSTSHNLENEQ